AEEPRTLAVKRRERRRRAEERALHPSRARRARRATTPFAGRDGLEVAPRRGPRQRRDHDRAADEGQAGAGRESDKGPPPPRVHGAAAPSSAARSASSSASSCSRSIASARCSARQKRFVMKRTASGTTKTATR